MISVVITNFELHKIIINSSSEFDVLFYDMFLRIKLFEKKLIPIQYLLYGFNGEVVIPVKVITIPFTLGTTPKYFNLLLSFLAVKVSLM